MPVPTAVPPSGNSATRGSAGGDPLDAVADLRRVAGELLPERDRRGVHQMRTAGLHDLGPAGRLRLQAWRRDGSAPASRSCASAAVAARWIDDGNTSLDDCDALTSSFGCTRLHRARVRPASRAPRSCSCSRTCPSRSGTRRSGTGRRTRRRRPSCRGGDDRVGHVRRDDAEIGVHLRGRRLDPGQRGDVCASPVPAPEIGKFSTARCVCARHKAVAGTRTSPMVSCSIRYSIDRTYAARTAVAG